MRGAWNQRRRDIQRRRTCHLHSPSHQHPPGMSSSSSGLSVPSPSAVPGTTDAVEQPYVDDSAALSDDDASLLATDPLGIAHGDRLSFKRKQRPSNGFSVPGLLGGASRRSSNTPQRPSSSRAGHQRNRSVAFDGSDNGLPHLNLNGHALDGSDPSGVDWNIEGPGRRVGYDDLTAIDWIFEYSKERQRLRKLYAGAHGVVGQIRQIADASQIWLVLIATGLASGLIAAFIDVASDWLGDLKTGYCSNEGGDGKFYLNKIFCCWGFDEFAQCADWHSWSNALGAKSKGGSYFSEYFVFVILSVFFAACASILVKHHAIYAKHSGIAEIKTVLGGFVIRYFMGTWTLVIKSLGLCLAVASGLWLGKEGPLVHVACCCANLFMKLFPVLNDNEARKREVLSAASAAGISVAFGSPIGGVLFSLEQLSYYFPDKTMWQSFVCAMIGAVSLHSFDPFRTNKLVMYQVTYHTGWHGFELIPFAFLGVLGGLYGGLFIKLNMKVARWRRDRPYFKGPVREVIVVAFLCAIINFPIKFMRAQASELLYFLFAECRDIADDSLGLCKSGRANTGVVTLLVISAFLGFFLATITFGLLLPTGILLPSMAIGALYGRAVGLFVQVIQTSHPKLYPFTSCEPDVPCVTPGTYAIIGAASALGGATRMTVTIVVIMFELTGALTYVLPIMIAVMISKWVGDAISARGIYEAWINFNGYPFLDNREDNNSSIPDLPAAQVMTRLDDLVVITATGHTISSLKALLAAHSFRGFPIIDNPRHALLLGYISRTELAYALSSALSPPKNLSPDAEAHFSHQPLADQTASLDLRPWMDQTPMTLNARASLQLTISMFSKLGLRYVVFVEKGCLRGLLTKKDVWFVLNGAEEAGGLLGDEMEVGGLREEGAAPEERGLLRGDAGSDDGVGGPG
ncbi:uncharacterized protein K452DRAFT_349989 [Aplosporella prunicola CBS 121167]|uniref:Chloride channel protein n=1 Tax=Aplosporella prunicola CBS 121167 TaxID=1176127 RepID=A0A6A6BKS9_9PEZI|nr:uncharacterized protein K452DRAFT_349989 [Aplosporella prunicola CBS 121167]KAF2144278.1 hypothetical protein K452DRAFT_349989 [Aplosporella prunicola CBS 121167]